MSAPRPAEAGRPPRGTSKVAEPHLLVSAPRLAESGNSPWGSGHAAGPDSLMGEDPRRAALALHALARQDRRWVLDRLAPSQRQLVSGLLGELRALRIPADAALLKSLRGPGAELEPTGHAQLPPRKTAARPPADTRSGAQAQATPEILGEWLAREPAFVVAACLLDLAPAQQDRVLARLAPSQAAAARALMAGPLQQAHALREAVRTAQRARHAPAGTVPERPNRWGTGWRTRLRALWSRA